MLEGSGEGDGECEVKKRSVGWGLGEVLSRETAGEEEQREQTWGKRRRDQKHTHVPEAEAVVVCGMNENATRVLREGGIELIKGLCCEDKAEQLPGCDRVN